MDMSNWFEDEARSLDNTTLKEFEKYVEDYLEQRAAVDIIEDKLKQEKEKMRKMEGKLRNYLEAQGLTSHRTRMGLLMINERTTFKAPEGEGREAAIEQLRETGDLENVYAFNAGKFSSWYKAQKEANPEFSLDGVTEEKLVYTSFRASK